MTKQKLGQPNNQVGPITGLKVDHVIASKE